MFLITKDVEVIMKYDNTHLTLQERQIIQKGIESRSIKTAIAQTIGKDPTTVAKKLVYLRKPYTITLIWVYLKNMD